MGALKNHYKFLIIGAGPTGLGAAYRLKELKEKNFLVIEKQAMAGGLFFVSGLKKKMMFY